MPQQDADALALASLTGAELAELTSAAGISVAHPLATLTPIAYDWGSPATAGLWRADVRSHGQPESPACAFFVKLVRDVRLWPGLRFFPDEASRSDFAAFYPWHFELDIHLAGIDSVMPAGMRTPVLYHAKRVDSDHIALWWEFITERPGPWQLVDYQRAAQLLGQLAARRRAGAAINDALPDISRTAHSGGSALRYYTRRRVEQGILPALRAGHVWSHPVMRAALDRVADPALPADLLSLGAQLPHILDMLDALPQTYAHGDASPQNLLLPANEPATVVVIDWGFGTLLPVGFDLGQLLVGLASAGQSDPSELPAIDAEIFAAYLDGMAAEDYKVEPSQVRAGYVGGLAARSAMCALPFEQLSDSDPDGALETLMATRLRLTRVLVDMAGEVWPTP
jgi:Phosphotransferase enzyme family